MRFLHTADWHLGRQFHNVSLIEDQAHALDQLVAVVNDGGLDAVLIAGDVFDRAVPPPEAVNLLDDVLGRIVLGAGVPVFMIAGNHDSPARLSFGAPMLAGQGLHVSGRIDLPVAPVTLEDRYGPVDIFSLPYVEPAVARLVLDAPELQGHDAALRALIATLTAQRTEGRRAVLMAHCFVAGSGESESERPLSVGGAGSVGADAFAGFDYVALGHLHGPQRAGSERIRYSGSLLKYSFSEAHHTKGFNVVELDRSGATRCEQIAIRPRRDVRIVEGSMASLIQEPAGSRDDYLLVRLSDSGAILDAMGRLREVYPNLLHLERPGLERSGTLRQGGRERLRRSERELFASFFEQMTGETLLPSQQAALDSVLADLDEAAREAKQ